MDILEKKLYLRVEIELIGKKHFLWILIRHHNKHWQVEQKTLKRNLAESTIYYKARNNFLDNVLRQKNWSVKNIKQWWHEENSQINF